MPYRLYNYCAFYVSEPFSPSNLGATATPDFNHYLLLKAWKSKDVSFHFYDAHETTYNVRDDSDWERTLKPRLHERLRKSKNILLLLSAKTICSRALREELDYGIIVLGLPIIIVYTDYSYNSSISDGHSPNSTAKYLWNNLPVLRDNISKVPSAHVPLNKEYINKALNDTDFTIQGKSTNYCWCY